ncbi:MAG: Na+/H+ antiporter NhaC family protein [Bacteroidetes bacterium]|nr:Na+/H+ antiporter NhaC family protein [Bacteroidota bacterium]
MKKFITLIFLLFSIYTQAENLNLFNELSKADIKIEYQKIIIQDIEANIKIIILNKEKASFYKNQKINFYVNGKLHKSKIIDNKIIIKHKFHSKEKIDIVISNYSFSKQISPIPLWLSILPPLIAIFIALLFKEVVTALFLGILVGTTTIYLYQDASFVVAFFKGMFSIADTYVIEAMSDKGHLSIIVFSMLIGATVNIITRNGGMNGIVNILLKYVKNARSGQLITWFLGLAIFFDDYANTLVVGNTMRPITDRMKISREKLSYIVDATAAPVAALALVTTWIGIELSYIQDGISSIGINDSAYGVFISSLNTRFYPIYTIIFMFILIVTKKDFGPMLKAERKARKIDLSQIAHEKQKNKIVKYNSKWFNAAIPVLIIILGTLVGLLYTGWDSNIWSDGSIGFSSKLSTFIGHSNSYLALLWASLSGVIVAIALSMGQKILNLRECIESLITGFKTMFNAILILILAWSLAQITKDLHTADFLTQSLVYAKISPYFLPTMTFILSAIIAFSTGSSWGTMAILYPLILPASWLICKNFGFDYNESIAIFYNVVSSILAGSVLGDHCSPISDTTILSSLASSCNHIEHVRTQLPYALTVGAVSIVFGTLPSAYGISSLILFPLGITVLYLVIKFVGKKVE